MNERIKELRKALNLTQQQFADRIGIKRNTIANYEIGRNDPVETVLVMICREFNVNREWLLNGIGEMFAPESNDELEALAKKYGYSAAVQVLIEKLVNLSPEQQEAVTDFLIEFAAGIQSVLDAGWDPAAKAFPVHEKSERELSIDEKVEIYRRSLEQEKEAGEKSEVS